jgi:lipopolysaccharide/colanic/teichoic acid biosynthesis glycosyltransferase
MQRFFDIIFSVLSLIFLAPALIPVAVFLRFTAERKVFFMQERVGLNGKKFLLIKFATMLMNSPNMTNGTVTLKNDPRILPFGKILRKTKINELPQLINILIGDMSLIGPRPQALTNFNSFPADLQKIIVKVKPGLSGLGSIIFRHEEEILNDNNGSMDFYNDVIAPYKAEVEGWYINNKNIFNYFLLMVLTVWVVVFPSSKIVWIIFEKLPKPPEELIEPLGYKARNLL